MMTPHSKGFSHPEDAASLAKAAEAVLAETLAEANRVSGEGERHRSELTRAIELARAVVDGAGEESADEPWVARALVTLVKAYAALARDSLHGVNQLSQASQRAPTRHDCDDGWQRVEGVAQVAEASAIEAAQFARKLDSKAARRAVEMAEDSAREARRIVDARNNAYTFHASPDFSFGEGWYAAAAAIIDSVSIQLELDQPKTEQAEKFLREAGLCHRLVPYHSRPRANKQLPDIIANAFRNAPSDAQSKLRAAFLGDEPVPETIVDWCDGKLLEAPKNGKVLLWLRYAAYQPERNTTHPELVELSELVQTLGLVPILIGDGLRDGELPSGSFDMTLFWKLPMFQGIDMRRRQLQLFEHLKDRHGLLGQIGVTTAGMDGPALMGLPTMYLTQDPNVRLGKWVGAVPGYQEIVRDGTHLNRISQTCRRWADSVRFQSQ